MRFLVVFDTNILLSALLSPQGSPSQCLELARVKKIESVTCIEILNEFQEKLVTKFKYSSQEAEAAIANIISFSNLVTIPNTLNVLTTDPDDNKILECAVVSGATHLITGDKKHLLPLKSYSGITIVNAADFLALRKDLS